MNHQDFLSPDFLNRGMAPTASVFLVSDLVIDREDVQITHL